MKKLTEEQAEAIRQGGYPQTLELLRTGAKIFRNYMHAGSHHLAETMYRHLRDECATLCGALYGRSEFQMLGVEMQKFCGHMTNKETADRRQWEADVLASRGKAVMISRARRIKGGSTFDSSMSREDTYIWFVTSRATGLAGIPDDRVEGFISCWIDLKKELAKRLRTSAPGNLWAHCLKVLRKHITATDLAVHAIPSLASKPARLAPGTHWLAVHMTEEVEMAEHAVAFRMADERRLIEERMPDDIREWLCDRPESERPETPYFEIEHLPRAADINEGLIYIVAVMQAVRTFSEQQRDRRENALLAWPGLNSAQKQALATRFEQMREIQAGAMEKRAERERMAMVEDNAFYEKGKLHVDWNNHRFNFPPETTKIVKELLKQALKDADGVSGYDIRIRTGSQRDEDQYRPQAYLNKCPNWREFIDDYRHPDMAEGKFRIKQDVPRELIKLCLMRMEERR